MHHLLTTLPRPGDIAKPLSSTGAVLVGLAAFAVVTLEEIWAFAQHVNVIAHEGAHALAGLGMGHKVARVELNNNATGRTVTMAPGGRGRVTTLFAGYVGPSAFGLLAAKLISLGYIAAVLWLGVALLAILLPVLRTSFGLVSVIVTGGLLFFVARYTTAAIETIVAYGLAWFLLLSGVRVVLAHGRGADDAGFLREATRLPRTLWSGLWLTGTVVALAVGGSLLV